MSEFSTSKNVEKLGSLWKGVIVDFKEDGVAITNFIYGDVVKISQHAKLWFEIGSPSFVIRGLPASLDSIDKNKPYAKAGDAGMIEFVFPNKSLFKEFQLRIGSEVVLKFRT